MPNGKAGGAQHFDGNGDYLSLSAPLPIGATDNTVALWVKVPKVDENGLEARDRGGIVLGNYPTRPHSNWEIYDDGQMRIYWNAGQLEAFGTTDLRDDKWHHLAWVRDKKANTFSMYVDSRLETTISKAGLDTRFSATHKVGADCRGGSMPFFHGMIDELMVFNRALSAAEITQVYNSQR